MTSGTETKSRILDVAEDLFAEQGLDRVSIRDITEAAGVNLAAVNYHFGGKEELISAVFERRIAPLNALRIQAIQKVEEQAGGKRPKVEDLLEAFIRPAINCCQNGADGGRAFAMLFGRCLAETRPEVETLLRKQFEPLVECLDGALSKALPHLSRTDIFWRMKFTFGALHHWMLTRNRFLPPWATETKVEAQLEKLVAFAAAGFKAP